MTSPRRRGFALLELVISMALLTVSLGALLSAMQSSISLWGTASKISLLEDSSRRALDAMCSELRWADRDTIVITAEKGSSRIDFRVPLNWDGTQVVWSTAICYHIEASPIDADNNGVPDEGRVVRVQDGQGRVLCERVRPGGLVITRTGDELQLQLGVQLDNRGRVLKRDTTTSVSPRNRSAP